MITVIGRSLFEVLGVKGTLSSPFTQFGNHHMADVLLEDEADYMGVVVRVFKAPVSIEMIPPDTELVFQGTVVQKGLWLSAFCI